MTRQAHNSVRSEVRQSVVQNAKHPRTILVNSANSLRFGNSHALDLVGTRTIDEGSHTLSDLFACHVVQAGY